MDAVSFVPQLGKALWDLKTRYDQHSGNKKEIKELQKFMQDYSQYIPALEERFGDGGGNSMGTIVLGNLRTDIVEATKMLKKWSTNKQFFRVLNSGERMRDLQQLHTKVMASVQKSLGIASLSMLLDLRDTHASLVESTAEVKNLLESTVEMKNLLITSIASSSGTVLQEVRAEAVEASQASFADEKFWADVLAAVDQQSVGQFNSARETSNRLYMDPLSKDLMIDPVVASNGHTYCRWTIIDNNITKDPHNRTDDLSIRADNVLIRSLLFEEYPEQQQQFQQRRVDYRRRAMLLASERVRLGDAVVALQHVLEWDKNDTECAGALVQVQEALQEAKVDELSSSLHGKCAVSKWDFELARPILTMKVRGRYGPYGHHNKVWIAWSRDGGRFATGMDETLVAEVWDSKSGRRLATLETDHVSGPERHGVHGWALEALISDAVREWRAKAGSVMQELDSNWVEWTTRRLAPEISSVAWDVEGGKLAFGCDRGRVVVCDATSGKVIVQLLMPVSLCGKRGHVCNVSWSSNGLLAATMWGVGAVWNVGSTKFQMIELQHKSRVGSTSIRILEFQRKSNVVVASKLAWSPDCSQLAIGYIWDLYYLAVVWDANTGEMITHLESTTRAVLNARVQTEWSPDGRQLLVLNGATGAIFVWGMKFKAVFLSKLQSDSIAWCRKGECLLVSGSLDDSALHFWDSRTGKEKYTLHGHTGPIRCVAWSPDGDRLATSSEDGTVIVWGHPER